MIRELTLPALRGNEGAGLAEATFTPGQSTYAQRHHVTEELSHVLQGAKRLKLAGKTVVIGAGDTALIPPGAVHWMQHRERIVAWPEACDARSRCDTVAAVDEWCTFVCVTELRLV